MDANAVSLLNSSSAGSPLSSVQPAAQSVQPADALSADDFFKLLIAQLVNQDPLEPTSNQELLQQVANIRDIQSSTQLTESLSSLAGQQRYASAAGLIGTFVTGRAAEGDESGLGVQGLVVGIRFTAEGAPLLQLADGRELPVENVETVTAPDRAAASLVGQFVSGMASEGVEAGDVIEGVVTQVRSNPDGTVSLELDTGQQLNFRDLRSVGVEQAVGAGQ